MGYGIAHQEDLEALLTIMHATTTLDDLRIEGEPSSIRLHKLRRTQEDDVRASSPGRRKPSEFTAWIEAASPKERETLGFLRLGMHIGRRRR